MITVQGRGSRTKFVKGHEMSEGRLPLKRFEDSFFRVTDSRGRRAWSNPVWLAE